MPTPTTNMALGKAVDTDTFHTWLVTTCPAAFDILDVHDHSGGTKGLAVAGLAAATFATPAIVLGTAAAAGVATTTIRSDSTLLAFDATAPTTSALADAAAVGVATVAARRDHKHGRESFATNAIVLGTAAAPGVATTPFRSDDTIAAFDATAPTTSAVGDAAAVGAAAKAARRDHTHGREAFATNAIVLSTAAAAGAATTLIRSDATIAAFDSTVPVTQALGDSAATGSAAFAARRDHKHGMPANPLAVINGGSGVTSLTPAAYTPSVAPASGTFTSVSVTGSYLAVGGMTFVYITVTVTTNGTAAGNVQVTLPVNATQTNLLAGRANAVSGKMLQGKIGSPTAGKVTIFNYDNSYPAADGEVLIVSGWYA